MSFISWKVFSSCCLSVSMCCDCFRTSSWIFWLCSACFWISSWSVSAFFFSSSISFERLSASCLVLLASAAIVCFFLSSLIFFISSFSFSNEVISVSIFWLSRSISFFICSGDGCFLSFFCGLYILIFSIFCRIDSLRLRRNSFFCLTLAVHSSRCLRRFFAVCMLVEISLLVFLNACFFSFSVLSIFSTSARNSLMRVLYASIASLSFIHSHVGRFG